MEACVQHIVYDPLSTIISNTPHENTSENRRSLKYIIIFGLGIALISCLIPGNRIHDHQETNPGQFLEVAAYISVISSLNQTALISVPFFYCPHFSSYMNNFYRNSNLEKFFGVMSYLKSSLIGLKKFAFKVLVQVYLGTISTFDWWRLKPTLL
jgi:hypothetical protein